MNTQRRTPNALFLSLLPTAYSLLPLPALAQETIPLREGVAIGGVGRYARHPVFQDALLAQIVGGTWKQPQAGETLTLPDGRTRTWEKIQAKADGTFQASQLPGGGYASFTVHRDKAQVMLLEANHHGMVYVNGEPRVGDPYGYGMTRLPVALRQGDNTLLFAGGRNSTFQAQLTTPKAEALLHTADMTLPDLVPGENAPQWGAIIVLNATSAPLQGLTLRVSTPQGRTFITPLPTLLPAGMRKVGFRLDGRLPNAQRPTPNASFTLELQRRQQGRIETLDKTTVSLRIRQPNQTQKRTFLSQIDGSVQYFALNPASRLEKGRRPALFLSLHGASVEAIGQADAYSSKSWGHLVAPTNRRPYGFDWEDWGRLDALEVLELAQKQLQTDPQRVYLTGHSMGGHGTWQVGATFPDRFAAIGPSAGWISFSTYIGSRPATPPTPMEQMLLRAAASSDTFALAPNYATYGVYILHGSADDNVPATEARTMNRQLADFHRDFVYFEQPNAGHWWDASDEPGADCVDWQPMFDFFARRSRPLPESLRKVDFTTVNPAVSAQSYWLTIAQQTQPMESSRAQVRCDPAQRRFVGTTENIARLGLETATLTGSGPINVELDGQKLSLSPLGASASLWLQREGTTWRMAGPPSAGEKGPQRGGPFRQAFQHQMVFVYGTQGTPEENAWAFAKARYDAETFWYRGNGSLDVLPDTEYDALKMRNRSVILYGNAATNGVWKTLLAESPVQVSRTGVTLGGREESGADLACLFLRPKPGSDTALVGVVAGTGLAGMRLTDRMPIFVSGAGYPDCTVFRATMPTQGVAGVRCAGFFGNDWRVETGRFLWQTP